MLYLNSDLAYCAVVLHIVTYYFRATVWKSSSSIIWVTLIIENLVIFCLHSTIDDCVLLFVPSDWWILDVPLSWFQFCFLVDVIIFISNFSGLVSCLLLIFYIKRMHPLDWTLVSRDWTNPFWWLQQGRMNLSILYAWWWKHNFWNVEFEKTKTVNHVQYNIPVCCNKTLLLHLSLFRSVFLQGNVSVNWKNEILLPDCFVCLGELSPYCYSK